MHPKLLPTLLLASAAASACAQVPQPFDVAHMPRIATVDERFQSYNVEMVEVTGGRFWAPYKAAAAPDPAASAASVPTGMDPSLYRYRQPIDLGNPRLRMLAAALGPAFVRVSGTWANSTFFQDSDAPAPATPPTGFGNVLTRAEWRGVLDFAHATDAKILSSFAISTGVRDADGLWTPVEAKPFLAFTKAAGGEIAAAEMFNEPTFASLGGAPKGYDAAAYARDFRVFVPFLKAASPGTRILGPGSVGEGRAIANLGGLHLVPTAGMLAAEGPGLDFFSYHFYGGVSQRCTRPGATASSKPETALSAEWLNRTLEEEAFYAGLRDRFAPGLPLWLTETGETACGGNPWASTFLDSFRYLNQLGALARKNVQVVAHNTLAASDYALIDETTLTPRPNYWAALLWRRLMGTTVLDAGPSPAPNLYVYAHCRRQQTGAVSLLVINADRSASRTLPLPGDGARYTLSAANLTDSTVQFNGSPLALTSEGSLPTLTPAAVKAGDVPFAPATITFLTLEGAANPACR